MTTATALATPPSSVSANTFRVIVTRADFLDALAAAYGIIKARTPNPLLQCVRLEAAADNSLVVTSTDLERYLRQTLRTMQVESAGVVLVPCEKLLAVVRSLSDETLTLHLDGEKLVISGGRSIFKLYTAEADKFPPFGELGERSHEMELDAAALDAALRLVQFANNGDGGSLGIAGVNLSGDGKNLGVAACDSRRLAVTALPSEAWNGVNVTFPNSSIKVLLTILDGIEGGARLTLDGGRVEVVAGDALLVFTLIEKTFPPYREVIPKDNDKHTAAATADVRAAVGEAIVLTTEESKDVRMAFGRSGLTITSRDPSQGESEIKFPCKFDGADIEIGVNPRYLAEALDHCPAEEVTIGMSHPGRPMLITSGPLTVVQMPVNLR